MSLAFYVIALILNVAAVVFNIQSFAVTRSKLSLVLAAACTFFAVVDVIGIVCLL